MQAWLKPGIVGPKGEARSTDPILQTSPLGLHIPKRFRFMAAKVFRRPHGVVSYSIERMPHPVYRRTCFSLLSLERFPDSEAVRNLLVLLTLELS